MSTQFGFEHTTMDTVKQKTLSTEPLMAQEKKS